MISVQLYFLISSAQASCYNSKPVSFKFPSIPHPQSSIQSHLLQGNVYSFLYFWRDSKEDHLAGIFQQREDTSEYQNSNKERAEGISNEPAKLPNQNGGDYHTDAA